MSFTPTQPIFSGFVPQVSIIILNWNGKAYLPLCLESLQSQTFRNFEIILVDNGSSDNSSDFIRKQYPWVILVELSQNVGFAAGNNIGWAHARGAYIVTLNNDTQADAHWLEELVAVADSSPQVGMVASRICSFDEPDVIDSLGMHMCRDGMSRGAYRRRRFSELPPMNGGEIFFPSACVALYKRAMLDEVGFFDDEFFAYCEDTDLGMRGRLAGWKALLATDAIVYHKYSQSSGEFSPFKLYLVERNHYCMAMKTFPWRHLALLPFYTCLRYFVQVQMVLSSKGSGQEFLTSASKSACLKSVGKGIFDAVRAFPRMLRKRRQVMRYKKVTNQEVQQLFAMYRLSFQELFDAG